MTPEDDATLSRRLRSLRKQAGLTGQVLAQRTGMSQSTISKIETGKRLPSRDEVVNLAKGLAVSPETANELLSLLEDLDLQLGAWRRPPRARSPEDKWVRMAGLSTTTVRIFQSTLVPSFLQTPEYAAETRRRAEIVASGDVGEVAARLDRQELLFRGAKKFVIVITESALRFRVGSVEEMKVQINRVAEVSRRDDVNIGIITLDTELPVVPHNNFCVFDEELVTAELVSGDFIFRSDHDVASYLKTFSLLQRAAAFGERSRAILADIASSLDAGGKVLVLS